jgi:hypothetical protein
MPRPCEVDDRHPPGPVERLEEDVVRSFVFADGRNRNTEQRVTGPELGLHLPLVSSGGVGPLCRDVPPGIKPSHLRLLSPTRIESRHLFRDLVDASAAITITEGDVVVRFQKRAHKPLLVAAGFDTTDVAIPWLGGKRLRLVFG